jgi:thiol-disulfide isomerase/thioredoxin
MKGRWRIVAMACLASCGLAAAPKERHALPTVPELRPAAVEEIEQAVREPGARAVLLNVWATWCGPCREEFPELVHLGREYRPRGLRLVLVSADFADQAGAARDFLRRQGVDFTTFLKTGDDMKFIDRLEPRWTGALPATFVYDGRGRLRHFHEGRTTYAELEPLVQSAMSATDSLTHEASP